MRKKSTRTLIVAALMAAASMALTSCIEGPCKSYTTSEVWLANGTAEPLYYAITDHPYLTPDCEVRKMPFQLAYILDFKQFTPRQVMSDPTQISNGRYGYTDHDEDYHYLLLLRYNDSVVACYDISSTELAQCNYPWFHGTADSTYLNVDNDTGCDDPELNYKYFYFITDNML